MKKIKHLIITPLGALASIAFSGGAQAAPQVPTFTNPAPEYLVDLTTTPSSPVSFVVRGDSVIPVSWELSAVSTITGQKTSVCKGVVAPTGAMFPPKTDTPSCSVPFIFGEAKVSVTACTGLTPSPGNCSTSATKTITKYTKPTNAPDIGTRTPNGSVIELFKDYKLNQVITFDTFTSLFNLNPFTIHIRDNTTNDYICSVNMPSSPPIHSKPKLATCTGSYSSLGAKTVYAEVCYAGKSSCSPKSATKTFNIIADPKTVLSTTNWEARKVAGMKGYNQPYKNLAGKTVAAYYTEWSIYGRKFFPKDIPVENLTHIYHSFIGVCGDNFALQAAQDAKAALGYPYRGSNDTLKLSCQGKQNSEVSIHDRDAAILSAPWLSPLDSTEKTTDPVRGIFAEYYRMKKVFPMVKILPSIGGGTMSDPLFVLAKDPAQRKIFIASAINLIHTYDFFDGVDIDWEFPVTGGSTAGIATPADAQAYVDLTRDLRLALNDLGRKMNRTYELHATFAGTPRQLEPLLLSDMNTDHFSQNNVDYYNLMTYDYYGPWGTAAPYNNEYGHQAAIDSQGFGNTAAGHRHPDFSADHAVNKAIAKGVPANKIRTGIAAYGRGWDGITGGNTTNGPFIAGATGGVPALGFPKDWISAELTKAQNSKRWEFGIADFAGLEKNEMGGPLGTGVNGWKLMSATAGNPNHQFLWNQSTGSFYTLDTPLSTEAKASMVQSKSLGGLILWSIDGDSGSLLNAIQKGYGYAQGTYSISNIATTAASVASSSYGNSGCTPSIHCYTAAKINDGSTKTTLGGTESWSNSAPLPQTLELKWPQKILVTGAEVYTSEGYPMSDYDLQYWNGVAWVNFVTVNGNTALQNVHNLIGNIVTDKVRINCRKGPSHQPHHARVNELVIKGSAL